ncbi:hypothetical protein [Dyella acidisoli]|uniref:Uncharacterized protein n=1 Tax=Dyella acidisoli TaxID=1867834 RepID=A0ABQ5XU17_9GAMM|nr:hypothetical protein [Dyella acidisoli]GLQ93814.1 hypothetical protein GCM10007901_27650 [Dyella acidisoli]
MTQTQPDTAAALRRVAEAWLKRPLTPAEEQELEQFQNDMSSNAVATASAVPSGDPAAHARAQAAQAVKEGHQRADSAIRNVLQRIQGTATQALQAQEREEQAILRVVQAARTLADLRPSALAAAGQGMPGAGGMVMSQIADRLANLVKSEVEQNFQQTFGRLQQQLQSAITELDAAKQQLQNALPASAPQTAPSPPPSAPQGGVPSSS